MEMDTTITVVTEKKIDAVTAPALGEELTKILDGGVEELFVEMENTTYISSVGLRVFLAAQKKVRANGGSMILNHVKPQVMEVFDITGFSGLLTFGE